jgi:hypothetical protein
MGVQFQEWKIQKRIVCPGYFEKKVEDVFEEERVEDG